MWPVRSTNAHAPFWEFALCPHKTLAEISNADLKREFYGVDDPRGTNVFGTNWMAYAIRVPERQVFLARMVTNRSVAYGIQLDAQQFLPAGTFEGGRMRIRYVAVTQ